MDFTIVIKISYNYDLLIWISLRRRSAILIGMTELIKCFKTIKCLSILLECMSTSGQCLTVNQTNQVCRDVGGACREAGQRWNHTTCFMVECRGPRISVVSDSK